MKEGWEYKLLGDFIKEVSVRDKGKGYPVYSVTNTKGFCQEFFGKNVASEDTSNYKVVPRGCFAYNPSRINVGSVAWQNQEENVSVSPLYVVFSVSPKLRKDYLLYYIKSNYSMTFINALSRGAVRNNLRLSTLKTFKIPYASVSEQQQIVEELDLLSSIIEKKNAQLNELDNLAQSLFYEMFGDPITNEKGWEIGEISNYINVKGGFAFKSQRYTNNGIRLVQIANVWKDRLSWNDVTYISEEDAKTNLSFLLKQGDIVMAMTRPIIQSLEAVKVAIVNEHDIPCILNQRVCKFEIRDSIDNIWLYQFLRLPYFKYKIKEFSSKGMQPNVSSREIESIQLFVPPLSLQQQFASKIEAIEHQKELIKQSIKEVETLFNSRMDYYFN